MGVLPWKVFVSELVGTALLVLIGLSLVIVMFGEDSFVRGILPSEGCRRVITGFLFGTTGALIALSPAGVRSGVYINPVVTLVFLLMGNSTYGQPLGTSLRNCRVAILGALPLLAWGSMGRSVAFGVTLPGQGYAVETVLIGGDHYHTTFARPITMSKYSAMKFRSKHCWLAPFSLRLAPTSYRQFSEWAATSRNQIIS